MTVDGPRTLRVRVNGVDRDVTAGTRVADLVDPAAAGVAVARDGEVVPRRDWSTTPLAEGDEVEIVRAVQGG